MAEDVPQCVVHDLVVGSVPACACPSGDLREDVVRQRRTKGFLSAAFRQLSILGEEELPSLTVCDGGRGAGPREQSSLSASLGKGLLRGGADDLGPVDVQELVDLQGAVITELVDEARGLVREPEVRVASVGEPERSPLGARGPWRRRPEGFPLTLAGSGPFHAMPLTTSHCTVWPCLLECPARLAGLTYL